MKFQRAPEAPYQHLSELINRQSVQHVEYEPQGTVDNQPQPATYLIHATETPPSATSLFSNHLLKTNDPLSPVNRIAGPDNWIFIVLFSSLSLIALIRILYSRKLRTLMMAPISSRHMSLVIRDADILTPTLKFYLQANYLAMVSLATYLIANHYVTFPDQSYTQGFYLYGIIFTGLAIIYSARIHIASFWGHLFKEQELSYKYKMNHHLMSIQLGIVLIPALATIIYFPDQWHTTVVLITAITVGSIYLLKLLKTIFFGLTFRWYAIVYIFLYLCTLEILPVLLLIKTIAKLYPA